MKDKIITQALEATLGFIVITLENVFKLPKGPFMAVRDRFEVALRRIATRITLIESSGDTVDILKDRANKLEERIQKLEAYAFRMELKSVVRGDHFESRIEYPDEIQHITDRNRKQERGLDVILHKAYVQWNDTTVSPDFYKILEELMVSYGKYSKKNDHFGCKTDARHPVQPTYKDEDGVIRFKPNAIVRYLLDAGPFDMNQLALIPFTKEDRQQFAQLIGYSESGYYDLSYSGDTDEGL